MNGKDVMSRLTDLTKDIQYIIWCLHFDLHPLDDDTKFKYRNYVENAAPHKGNCEDYDHPCSKCTLIDMKNKAETVVKMLKIRGYIDENLA